MALGLTELIFGKPNSPDYTCLLLEIQPDHIHVFNTDIWLSWFWQLHFIFALLLYRSGCGCIWRRSVHYIFSQRIGRNSWICHILPPEQVSIYCLHSEYLYCGFITGDGVLLCMPQHWGLLCTSHWGQLFTLIIIPIRNLMTNFYMTFMIKSRIWNRKRCHVNVQYASNLQSHLTFWHWFP